MFAKRKTFFSRFHTRTHLPQMQQFNECFPGQTIQNMCFLNLICSAQFRVNTTCCSETDRCSLEEASVGMAHILFKFPEHEKEQHKEFSPPSPPTLVWFLSFSRRKSHRKVRRVKKRNLFNRAAYHPHDHFYSCCIPSH